MNWRYMANKKFLAQIAEYQERYKYSQTLHADEYYNAVVKALRHFYYLPGETVRLEVELARDNAVAQVKARAPKISSGASSDDSSAALRDATFCSKKDGIIRACNIAERILDELEAEG